MDLKSLKELRALSREQLEERYDSMRQSGANLTLDFFLNEIHRRDQEEHSREMMRLTQEMHAFTKQMRDMTTTIKWATLAALGVSALALVASVFSLFKH